MSFPERTIAQAKVVVKAMSRAYGVVPLVVELVEGTRAEDDAWRKEAVTYLIARAKGVRYKPEGRGIDEELWHD